MAISDRILALRLLFEQAAPLPDGLRPLKTNRFEADHGSYQIVGSRAKGFYARYFPRVNDVLRSDYQLVTPRELRLMTKYDDGRYYSAKDAFVAVLRHHKEKR